MFTTKIISILASVLVLLSIVIAYHQGKVNGMQEVEGSCQERIEAVFQSRKNEIVLRFCDMPPPVIVNKTHLTSDDN